MNRSLRTIVWWSGLFLIGSAVALAQAGPPKSEPPKLTDIETKYCDEREGTEIAYADSTTSLLKLYRINTTKEAWVCYSLTAPWLARGQVVSLRIRSAQVDQHDSVTLLRTNPDLRLWVIPVVTGMLEYPCLERDIHNIAAFNALLAENSTNTPKSEFYLNFSVLYLRLIGMKTRFGDWNEFGTSIHGLVSSPSFFHKKSLQSTVKCEEDGCSVTVNDTYATAVNGTVSVWKFDFVTTTEGVQLDSVEREAVPLSSFP